MNELEENKHRFFSGELTNPEFIEAMFESHRTQHAYAECLVNTNQAAVTVRDKEL